MRRDPDDLGVIDLTRQAWTLRGWRPNDWRLSTAQLGFTLPLEPEVGPLPARIPGSVQAALLQAKLIPDPYIGMNSRACAWVETLHWEFSTQLEPGAWSPGTRWRLEADGLDHAGWLLVDGVIVADFSGTLVPHTFDLGDRLCDGNPHRLSVIFDVPPAEQGQIGFTSRSTQFKPRFNYGWDWCPRLVPIGFWDALRLVDASHDLELHSLRAELEDDLRRGAVDIRLQTSSTTPVCLRLHRDGREVFSQEHVLEPGENAVHLELPEVEPWWPSGMGAQSLYELEVVPADPASSFPGLRRRIGFKRVRWLPCEDAPPDAEPWLCEINGRPVFLQGVNWTPVRLDYHGVNLTEYAHRIDLYRDLGCNLLRVWGGAFLERSDFYDLCDEAGLLVWQEFPLSSSALDNAAPSDPAVIAHLCEIASSYIRRRAHHASLLLWCGGNELTDEHRRPLGLEHPCLEALGEVVEREDPGRRFVPTSALGPRFDACAEEFGLGLHHDVHGPWNLEPDATLETWAAYWAADDALLRSEVGMPGASSLATLERYVGDGCVWPPTRANPYWRHASNWWVQAERFEGDLVGLDEDAALARYVELSQALQARALEIAARACRERFPRCGGFLVWMGHDAFPCPVNTSIIDFDGVPKPAYHALRRVFTAKLETRAG